VVGSWWLVVVTPSTAKNPSCNTLFYTEPHIKMLPTDETVGSVNSVTILINMQRSDFDLVDLLKFLGDLLGGSLGNEGHDDCGNRCQCEAYYQ